MQFAPDDERVPRPIDAFFDFLGASLGERSVSIVLSGTVSDGALGLTLVAEALHASGKSDGEASPRMSRRVLVADDNRDGAESLSMLLELAGHEVHLAHSGTQAWEVANKIRPDAAVLDIGMPGLSGYQVAERIRREPWGADMTLIALTGWGQENDKRHAEASGFDHHCTKPVDPDNLQRLLSPRVKD